MVSAKSEGGEGHADEFMSVSITREGVVTSHNAYDANFDEMVEATRKIVAALQERIANRLKCPFAAGNELRATTPSPDASPDSGEAVTDAMRRAGGLAINPDEDVLSVTGHEAELAYRAMIAARPSPSPAIVKEAWEVERDKQHGFGEDHSRIYGDNYGDRSVKRSHRGEGRNYVD